MRKFVWLLAAPLALFAIACASPTPSSQGGGVSTDPIVITTTNAAEKVAEIVSPAAPAGPFTAFKDGQYEVGNAEGQIKPGKYKTTVPSDSWGCYWERQKDLEGTFNSIIANDTGSANQPMIVTIKNTDKAFKAHGCGTWVLSA